MNMDEQELKNYQTLLNNRPIEDFENYSPNEMHYILYDTFHENSVINFQDNPSQEILNQIPFLLQVKFLLNLIDKQGEIKLTSKGFLPTKIVSDIYSQGYLKDELIESGINKLYKETDSDVVSLTRIISEISGLARKSKGKLTLTKTAKELLKGKKEFEILKIIFIAFTRKFNWGYFDLFENESIGQLGFGFTLILLDKYGDTYRTDEFYSEKYLKAFPFFREEVQPDYWTVEKEIYTCYSVRTFERFLNYFNFIELKKRKSRLESSEIKKTSVFDAIFRIEK